jgi:hypothetical protein
MMQYGCGGVKRKMRQRMDDGDATEGGRDARLESALWSVLKVHINT